MTELELKYGCNPNQKPARIFMEQGELPLEVLNGRPGYINFMDALNSWQLVKELKEAAADHDYAFSFLQDIPLGKPERLEGYLYPDTYEFTTPHNTTLAINKMLVRFDEQFTDEMRQEVADGGRTIYEILTVASMIERETDGTDQARIASVIYNRLDGP